MVRGSCKDVYWIVFRSGSYRSGAPFWEHWLSSHNDPEDWTASVVGWGGVCATSAPQSCFDPADWGATIGTASHRKIPCKICSVLVPLAFTWLSNTTISPRLVYYWLFSPTLHWPEQGSRPHLTWGRQRYQWSVCEYRFLSQMTHSALLVHTFWGTALCWAKREGKRLKLGFLIIKRSLSLSH